MVLRRDKFRGSKIMQDRVMESPKINVVWNTEIDEVLGENKVEALRLKNVETGDITKLPVDGIFVAIGHRPNTEIFKKWLDTDEHGYIEIHHHHAKSASNIPGVFIAGDVYDHRYRQAVTAAASGCKAALDAEKYLEALVGEKGEILTPSRW